MFLPLFFAYLHDASASNQDAVASTEVCGAKHGTSLMQVTHQVDSAMSARARTFLFHRGDVTNLTTDGLFKMSWSSTPGGTAHVASEKCDSFLGNGFNCYREAPEHELVQKWIPANATVLEFGARFGTTTCEIAKKLQNSGQLVTVEPDHQVWGDLETNIKSHNCHAHVLRGAINALPTHMLNSGYGGRSAVSSSRRGLSVPTFTFDEVEEASGLKFDTLLIDCEGCAQDMMDQIGPKIKGQINLIIIEADMPDNGGDCKSHCMNYPKFFDFLETNDFVQVDELNDCDHERSRAPDGTWCGAWINHYAFRRQQ